MAAKSHVETEIKLDAPSADVPLPDLDGLPGVAEVRPEEIEHEAVYFDTADLALLRSRITLRRREGGPDQGWHLKRPLDGSARSETHLPLGRATRTVPVALRRQVQVHVRRGTLVPVATLRTHRTVHRLLDRDGAVLAEVCDDVVHGTVGGAEGAGSSWREWEVELVDGDAGLLDAAQELLVVAGGAPAGHASKVGRVLSGAAPDAAPTRGSGMKPSRAGAVVWEHLAGQVAELTASDPLVRTDEADAVHRMRVATRRLRAALKTFRPVLDREVTDPLRAELKALGGVLGDARDAEVMRERLGASVAEQPVELVVGPVARRLEKELGGRYRAAHGDVLAFLDSERYLQLLDDLDRLLSSPPWRDAAHQKATKVLGRPVRRAHRALRKEVAGAAGTEGAERDAALHECRKAAKRARYAAEAVAPAFGKHAGRLAVAMEDVQDALGEHQDAVVARQVVRELGVQAHLARENAFTWGVLHRVQHERADEAERAFEEVWTTASRPRLRRWTRD